MRRSSNTGAGVVDLACACASARRAARTVTQMYDSHLVGSGMEATQFALLSLIDRLGPSSQAAIGEAFAMDKTTVSRNVTLLRKKGWIEESPSSDRRHRAFVLSAGGRKSLAAAKPAWRRAQQRLRSTMTAQEWDAMFGAFRSLARATNATS
jgi:DNA-binding MarR family transcriptional regulator